MTSQCHQTESPASSFGMLVNASINSGCHCSDTGNTLPGATPHSSSSGTSSSSGRNSTYAMASGMGTTCSNPDQAAYQRALSSPGMSETRNIWWCCPPCTLQLPYDVPHARIVFRQIAIKDVGENVLIRWKQPAFQRPGVGMRSKTFGGRSGGRRRIRSG